MKKTRWVWPTQTIGPSRVIQRGVGLYFNWSAVSLCPKPLSRYGRKNLETSRFLDQLILYTGALLKRA
jgi:hypothetical protein